MAISIFLIAPVLLFAQAPLGFNYQGIAREADGTPISSKEIAIRVSIIDGPQGSSQFDEIHFLTTNNFGLFTAVIGQGNGNGTLNQVNWAGGNLWLQIELDPDDSGNFILMGSQQLMSVPYALFAQESGEGLNPGYGVDINNGTISNVLPDRPITLTGKGTVTVTGSYPNFTIESAGSADGDADASNELQTIAKVGNTVTLSNSGGSFIDEVDDADADAHNEIQDLLLVGNELTITKNGTATTIDLTPYLDNTDTQLTEVEVDAYANNNGYLTLEVDGSITNEIQDLQLTGNNLAITNNGTATTIDLTPYLDNTDTQLTEAEVDAYANNNGYLTTEVDGSVSNELQDLSISVSGTDRTLGISGGTGVTVNVADNDNLPTNELQTISKVGNIITLSNGGGSFTDAVDDADNNSTNELQDLSISVSGTDRTLGISGGTGVTVNVADNDNLPTNELQTISKVGNIVTLSNGGGSFTDAVDDADNNINNEIQNLSEVLTEGADAGNTRITNLADPVDSKDVVNVQYLEAKIATDYAFKSIVNDIGTGAALTFDLATFDFDEGSLITTTQVEIAEAGVYLFTIKGTSTHNAPLVINVNNTTDYLVGLINLGKYYDTILLKLSLGDIIELRANSTTNLETFVLEFFGYKI